jgi:PcRGLX-like protein central beta sandwich domain
MSRKLLAVLTFILLGLSASALAWEIPLELKEHRGKGGKRYVSGGVPLLPGQAGETSQLFLARKGAAGLVPVPAQFRVLAKWWRKDNSIRWVLVDFQTDIKAGEKQSFVLTDKKLALPAQKYKLTVSEAGGQIVINTGRAKFAVPKTRFSFLASAMVDADGDGKFSADEEMLSSSPDLGTVLTDKFGEKYFSSEQVRSVEVIERGPMRVRVRARGVHKARGGKGYSKGFYSYDYFMDFYVGSTVVFSDVIIGNNFARSIGTPVFEDASLLLKLKNPISEYSLAGHRGGAHAGKLSAGKSACLYQDSNGSKAWQRCPGVANMRSDGWHSVKTECSSFRGYKVFKRTGGKVAGQQEIAKGDQATGTVHVKSGKGGLVMHVRNFWQQFPKGVEVFADGRLRLALFPGEYKAAHFLEDASAKGHEIVLHFYAGKTPDVGKIAGAWESKVLPRPARLEHIAACGALADLGPFSVPGDKGMSKKPNNRTEAYGSRMLGTDKLYGNAYGWQVFGERWRSCGGHSKHGARQPMDQDNYLYRWFATGVHGWFLNGDARSRQFRDVRCFRIEDVDPFSYKDWKHFKANNRSEDWTRRSQPKDAEVTKYQQGRYGRTTWWLPNPAHMTMDLLYDRYLLMGDQRAFENMRIIAAHGGYYSSHYKNVHRATGWSLRACYRYWELTGDKKTEALLKRCIANFKKMAQAPDIKLPMRGKTKINWWFTFVFSRAAAMTAMHTGDPDALFVLKRMGETITAKHTKPYASASFSEVWAVLYHLTGDEKYKQGLLGEDEGARLNRVYGGMCQPAGALWLVRQPPKKK